MKVGQTIEFARRTLSGARDGYLNFGMRNRIWDAMASDFPENWAQRKAALAHIVASETLPKWNALDDIPLADRRLPYEMLNAARERIVGQISEETSKKLVGHFDRIVDDFYCRYATQDRLKGNHGAWPTHALYAGLKALEEAAWMTLRIGNYDSLDDMGPDSDVHFVACCDLVGEKAGDVSVADECCRYWFHWLDDLLPRVLTDYHEVQAALLEF
jgi:hypothetical protein